MAYTMGCDAKISKGYGIVIVGRCIEFYRYDVADARRPMAKFAKDSWSLDMSTTSLVQIDELFGDAAMGDVHYQNAVVATGSSR